MIVTFLTCKMDESQIWIKALLKHYQHIVPRIVKLIPVIIGVSALVLMLVDQGTDIVNSYQICNVQCSCVWVSWIEGCYGPMNAHPDKDPCFATYRHLTSSVQTETFHLTAGGGISIVEDYCNVATNESECNEMESWTPKTYRHPLFCQTSIATILLPSIINSTYLLIRLWALYPSVLSMMGLPEGSYIFCSLRYVPLILYILQILPYAWLAIIIWINLQAWWIGKPKSGDEREAIDSTSKRSKLIFTILEDTPQLLLHSFFIMNSVISQDNQMFYAGIDMLNVVSYLGVTSSAASIAITLTLFRGLSTYKTAAVHFLTTFISVGTRASICASYATSVLDGFGPLIWTLVLPPATAIGLFIIEHMFFFVYKFVMSFNQSYLLHNVTSLQKDENTKQIKDYIKDFYERVNLKWSINSDYIFLIRKNPEKILMCIVSLTFEANSTQCLIPSYTYLAYAVALNTVWISASEESIANYTTTQTTFTALQYLSLASLLLNLLIVQWEGKDKVRCLVYSLIYLLFMGVVYVWVKNDFKHFNSIFMPDTPDDYIYSKETIQRSLSSLTFLFYMSGIIAFINILLQISSFTRGSTPMLISYKSSNI
ncbi:unnamed protein product [Meganyctiphanes norvegica]|uniref:Uncharacterized protein n=1 Tax=Meganyctiphanes norvegica TaxID=48144 RepID=A0AAV2RD94_MEGNR